MSEHSPTSPASLAGTPEQTEAPKPGVAEVAEFHALAASFQHTPRNFVICRKNGEALARIDLTTGRVALHAEPDEAARAFWTAVEGEKKSRAASPASSDVLTAEIERLKAQRLALAKMAVPVADHPLAGFANPITASHTKALAIRVLEGRADD